MSDVLQKSAESKNPRGHLDPAGFDQHVEFHTYLPPDDLAAVLEHFWTLSWNESGPAYKSMQVMHRPYVDLFISDGWSGIQGTFRGKRTYTAAGRGRIIGVRFLPGAFHGFWPGNMAELEDAVIGLTKVFPEIDAAFQAELLDKSDQAAIQQLLPILRARLPRSDTNVVLINQIIAATESDPNLQTVAAVAHAYGKSERWLQQLFQDYIGVGLKWLLQRQKLLAAAESIRATVRPDWTAIAYDAGYSSQQHFITDFKKVLGATPVNYRRSLVPQSQK